MLTNTSKTSSSTLKRLYPNMENSREAINEVDFRGLEVELLERPVGVRIRVRKRPVKGLTGKLL